MCIRDRRASIVDQPVRGAVYVSGGGRPRALPTAKCTLPAADGGARLIDLQELADLRRSVHRPGR
eukprot:13734058-Alexandrium_andersonii.AAC.1